MTDCCQTVRMRTLTLNKIPGELHRVLRPNYGWLDGEDIPLNSSFWSPRFVAAT